jgi:hypothetical protein
MTLKLRRRKGNVSNVRERSLFIPFLAPTGAWVIHETSRFTSVSLYRTVRRTPCTSDQLIARLPTQDNTNKE